MRSRNEPATDRTNISAANGALTRRRALQASAALAAGWMLRGTSPAFAEDAAAIYKQLHVHSELPLNAEPALAQLVQSRITPLALFYVRSHGAIPQLKSGEYRLAIEGLVHKPLTLSLDQIADKFKKTAVEATLTCAGNRRSEMNAVKPVGGVQWDPGAIGNAVWSGAVLADVLRAAEIKDGAKHVWFEGLDSIEGKDGKSAPFGCSIELEKALAAEAGVPGALLAYEMNEQALSPAHGFPLRTLVPGFIGARSVKWLGKIVVSDRPSPNHYLTEAYKIITSDDKEKLAAAKPIFPFPINAAICTPAAGAKLKSGNTTITGYALPAGEKGCVLDKVEISSDGGKTWVAAKLAGPAQAYTWRLWSLDLPLTPAVKQLIVRATDSRGHKQPMTTPWNFKGYMQNGWHHVKVTVEG
jgi:sulfite oxidase